MEFLQTRMGSWEVFWVLFYGFATYGNAGFMREQVCKYMCPYARFQSAMFDRDTLIVSYDTGARRAARRACARRDAAPASGSATASTASCACRCARPASTSARACSTNASAAACCVDACNTVMDKMDYPRGLIRYRHAERAWPAAGRRAQMLRRVLRPRVLVYTAVLLALCVGLLASLVAAHAAEGRRGARPRLRWRASSRAGSSRTSTACRS